MDGRIERMVAHRDTVPARSVPHVLPSKVPGPFAPDRIAPRDRPVFG